MWFWFWLWGEAGIGDGPTHALMTTSDSSRALEDLLYAVWQSGAGAPETRCSWEEEPGEYRWIFRRDEGRVWLRILRFRDLYDHLPDDNGTLVFETRQSWFSLATAITVGAAKTFDESRARGWPPPTALLELIRAQLAAALLAVDR